MHKVDEAVKYIKSKYVKQNQLDIEDNRENNSKTNKINFNFKIVHNGIYAIKKEVSLRLFLSTKDRTFFTSAGLIVGDKKKDSNDIRNERCKILFGRSYNNLRAELEHYPLKTEHIKIKSVAKVN